jgi:hypothetical protein
MKARTMGAGTIRAVTVVSATSSLAVGLALVVLMWRDALQYRDEAGEGHVLLFALIATGVVGACCVLLALSLTSPSTRLRYRLTWAALVAVISIACAASMSAAVNG